MNDTPRTDAVEIRYANGQDVYGQYVPASFARTLERELAEAKTDALEELEPWKTMTEQIKAERDKLAKELISLAVSSVTANPNVLHHYKCELCGARWSGHPSKPEQHKEGCLAAALSTPPSTALAEARPLEGYALAAKLLEDSTALADGRELQNSKQEQPPTACAIPCWNLTQPPPSPSPEKPSKGSNEKPHRQTTEHRDL